jgi:sarcosine oxidase subunit gamma
MSKSSAPISSIRKESACVPDTLAPRPPLGNSAPRRETIGPYTLTEVTGHALATSAPRRDGAAVVASALAARFGLALPGPGGLARAGALRIFSSARDQWMIETPLEGHEDIAALVAGVLGPVASVTEQTDGWVRIDVDGADLPRLFERLTPADLRGQEGPAAIRTAIEHVGAFVVREVAGGPVSVYALRSFAGSIWHAIAAAARAVAP